MIEIDKSEPVISKDHNGNTHAEKKVIDLTDYTRQVYLEKEVDSLKKALGVRENQIVGLTTANSRFRYEIKYIVDSVDKLNKKYIINQKGKWFSARGVIPSKDPIVIEGRDSITVAFINKRGRQYANISSYNPAIEYYGLRSFIVPPKRRSGLGIGASGEIGMTNQFKYEKTYISGGLKFMSVGDKFMYDASAGYRFEDRDNFYPYIGVGVYRRIL